VNENDIKRGIEDAGKVVGVTVSVAGLVRMIVKAARWIYGKVRDKRQEPRIK